MKNVIFLEKDTCWNMKSVSVCEYKAVKMIRCVLQLQYQEKKRSNYHHYSNEPKSAGMWWRTNCCRWPVVGHVSWWSRDGSLLCSSLCFFGPNFNCCLLQRSLSLRFVSPLSGCDHVRSPPQCWLSKQEATMDCLWQNGLIHTSFSDTSTASLRHDTASESGANVTLLLSLTGRDVTLLHFVFVCVCVHVRVCQVVGFHEWN